MQALLAKGAKPDARQRDGLTALMMAGWEGRADVAEALLAAGAEINAAQGATAPTALVLASQHGRDAVVRALLARKRRHPNGAAATA